MGSNKRLGINLLAQLFAFAVAFVINFFLAPFVIEKLGAEAYGYIGLANNFVSYTTLITIALNSMASRFITISFHQGDITTAKKYFSSVYYANLFLAIVIAVVAIILIVFLNFIINIPKELIWDVKVLFALTFINSIIALISNVYLVATFIKNRLDLSSLRNIIANLLRFAFIITPFMLFPPHLWYYGISALVATIFIAITNKILTKRLLPNFIIEKDLYDIRLVKELIYSGIWNLITNLSQLLATGIDLLIANIFISSLAMGVLSISKAVPIIILSLCSSVATVFAPKLTEFYAKGGIRSLENELFNTIRIMSIVSVLPLVVFLILGQDFFRLWIPTQDSHSLYIISSIAVISLLVSMPQESLWSIFTITNRVRISSYYLLLFNVLIFISTVTSLIYLEDDFYRLLSIVIARCFWESICSVTFLPIYGAKCLGFKWYTFYPLIFKNVILVVTLTVALFLLKKYMVIIDWSDFILFTILISSITLLVLSYFILAKEQRAKYANLIKEKLSFREKN